MFGTRILIPDKNREAHYDSLVPEGGRYFLFACASCRSKVSLDLKKFIGNYQDRDTVLGANQSEAITQHFSLRQDRSLVDGWPRFRVEHCGDCDTSYLVYVAVHEPRNGWYKLVPQGITALPSQTSS